MTIDGFFEELEKSGLKFYVGHSYTTNRRTIRIKMEDEKKNKLYCCPITALHFYKTRKFTSISLHQNAALSLGLSKRDGMDIALAADDDLNYLDTRIRKGLLQFVQ
jgi:hypothetical protein